MGWLDDLGENITNPVVQWFLSQFAGKEYGESQDEYETRVDQQISRYLGTARGRVEEGPRRFEEDIQPAEEELLGLQERIGAGAEGLVGETRRSMADFLGRFAGRGANLVGDYRAEQAGFLGGLERSGAGILEDYGGRYSFAQSQLDQLGGQQRADVQRTFDEEQARVTLDLQQRGLLSSTEAARGGYDVAERRAGALGRLEESLTRERIDVLSALSGEQLGAAERLASEQAGYGFAGQQTMFGARAGMDAASAAYEAAMRGDVLGAERGVLDYDMATSGAMADFYGGRATNLSNLYMGASGDYLNALANINYQPPQQNPWSFMFGQGAVDPVRPPSSWEMMRPGAISAAGNVAGAAIMASDRNLKEDIRPIDVPSVLEALDRLPVHKWRYKVGIDADRIEHIGPMAQDFRAAFGVGTETTIHPIDVAGVLIASVQALYAEVRRLRQETHK